MKQLFWVLFVLCSIAGNCCGEELYSIRELQSGTEWREYIFDEYIDIVFELPSVDRVPIISVKLIDSADAVYVEDQNSPVKKLRGTYTGSLDAEIHLIHKWDLESCYAECSDLSLGEAFETIKKRLRSDFNDIVEIGIDQVVVKDRLRKVDSAGAALGEPLANTKGFYLLDLNQTFYGIPLLVSIVETLNKGYTMKAMDTLWPLPMLKAQILDENSYLIEAVLRKEVKQIHEDVPLCGLETIKNSLRNEILNGRIRRVKSIKFGYCLYPTPDNNISEQYLIPVWVCECLFYDSKDSATRYDESLIYTNQLDYKELIINAQTGILVDPLDDANATICPQIVIWN